MRGARSTGINTKVAPGIIPAYAGSTYGYDIETVLAEDHPRVCGEHLQSQLPPAGLKGSSPRMRGAPGQACSNSSQGRIIPAYAGSTVAIHALCQRHKGSSPRMRGAH